MDGKPPEKEGGGGAEPTAATSAAAPSAPSPAATPAPTAGSSRQAAYHNRRRAAAAAKRRGPFVKITASDSELPDRVRFLAYRLLNEQCRELFLPVHFLLDYRAHVDNLLLDLQKGGHERLCLADAELDDAVRDTRWWQLDRVEQWLKPQVVQWCEPLIERLQREGSSPSFYAPPVIGEVGGLAPVRRFVEVSTASLVGKRTAQEDCVMTCSHWGNYFGGPSRHARLETDERLLHPMVAGINARRESGSERCVSSPGRSGSQSPRGRAKKKPRSVSPVGASNPGALDKWKRSAQYFALVADGHGGTEAAVFTRDLLLPHLLRSEHFPFDLAAAWREAFGVTHASFISRAEQVDCEAGTTLLCSLVWGTRLHYAWAGDSEGFLYRSGKPHSLTRPHRPSDPDEKAAVEARGGSILSMAGALRVDGRIGVTRAVGGKATAEHLSHEPETGSLEISAEDEFVVLATDGVWDVFSPQEVYDFVSADRAAVDARVQEAAARRRRMSTTESSPASRRETLGDPEAAGGEDLGKVHWDYQHIAHNLCAEAIAKGSSDNCSAAVCFFHHVPAEMSGKNPV
eukprot:Hpha_TRINITY_DN16262_c2_g2::TRINITY_DN16262_c2_g2_i1::g.15492::m.15492/K17501/PPM1E, POPX1; protein phosphatase 1E